MRIILCANTSWYLYNFRKNLITALQQQGHDVHAVSPPDDYVRRLTAMGVVWHPLTLHQTSRNPVKELNAIRQLFDRISAIGPDVVLSYTVKCNLYVGFLRYIFRFRQIATIAGLGEGFDNQGWLQHLIQLLYTAAFRRVQKVFFQNDEDRRIFTMSRIVDDALCERVTGSGVDILKFTPAVDWPVQHRRRFFMFGRIVPKKGYELFLEVARRVQEQDAECGEFWILGIEDRSRSESVRLLKKIQDFHHQKIITYFPARDDVLSLLQQADVVVLPSHYHEGVPRSLLEGMACGKPIITTDWKGCRDTVEHMISGLLVAPGNVEALYDAVNFFVRASDETLRSMGMAGLKKVKREFDERQVLAKYLAEIAP